MDSHSDGNAENVETNSKQNPFDGWLTTWDLMDLKSVFVEHKLTSPHMFDPSSPRFNELINDPRIPKQARPRILEACKQQTPQETKDKTRTPLLLSILNEHHPAESHLVDDHDADNHTNAPQVHVQPLVPVVEHHAAVLHDHQHDEHDEHDEEHSQPLLYGHETSSGGGNNEQSILQEIDMELRMLNNIELHFRNQKENDLRYSSTHKSALESKVQKEFGLMEAILHSKQQSILNELHEVDRNHISNLAKIVYEPIFHYVSKWRTYFEQLLNEYQEVITDKTGTEKQICLVKIQHNLAKIKFDTEQQWQMAQEKMNKIIEENLHKKYCDFVINHEARSQLKEHLDQIASFVLYKSTEISVASMNSTSSSLQNNGFYHHLDDLTEIQENENDEEEEEEEAHGRNPSHALSNGHSHKAESHVQALPLSERKETETEIVVGIQVHPMWMEEHNGTPMAIHPPDICKLLHIGRQKLSKTGGITTKIWSCCGEEVGKTLGCSRTCGNVKAGCKWKWSCCGKYGALAPGCCKTCSLCQQTVTEPGCCRITPLLRNSMDQLKELYAYD